MDKLKEKLQDLFTKIQGFLKKAGPDSQLKELMARAAEDPTDLRLKLQIGKLHFKKKDVEGGIAIYREVAEKYTQDDFILKAIAIYKEILRYSPRSVEFNEKLGDLFHKMDMNEDASQQFQIAIHYHQNHHNLEEALRILQKLVEVEPEEHDHRVHLAEAYFQLGQEKESLEEYETIARDLRKDMKNIEGLVEVYEKVLLKKPEEKNMLRELCVFYLKLSNPNKAIRKIERNKLEEDEQFKVIYQKALEMKDKES